MRRIGSIGRDHDEHDEDGDDGQRAGGQSDREIPLLVDFDLFAIDDNHWRR